MLGYDVDRSGPSPKLVINTDEAVHAADEIFAMYLEMQSLLPVVEELERLRWFNKSWRTRSGKERGGYLFDKSSVHYLLKNPLYIGRIKHKEETFKGEHQPIVDRSVRSRANVATKQQPRQGQSDCEQI